MSPRRYEQRLRAESAEETRRRVLEALAERLRRDPTRPVRVDEVARLAGFARSTVYLVFGSRAGLFDALAYDLLERDGSYSELLEAVALPDARETLRRGVAAGVRMFANDRDVGRVLYSMARLDPDAIGGAIRRIEKNRTRGLERLAERLAEQDALLPGISAGDAAHVLWLMTSFDAFDLLYADRGLPADEVARLLASTAERALCTPAESGR